MRQKQVTVAKRRQQWPGETTVLGFGKGSAYAEETVLRVSMLVTNAQGESAVVEEVWTTVCVEGVAVAARAACPPLQHSPQKQPPP